MKKSVVRIAFIGSLMALVAATAYAPAGQERINFYYSDSGLTNEVGEEDIPGFDCPGDSYYSTGDLGAPYRRIVIYSFCNWQVADTENCQYYDSGWHAMQCPN